MINPINSLYIGGNIDDVIDNCSNNYAYIFGYSEKLVNAIGGYWFFVKTIKLIDSSYIAQIAFAISQGKIAFRTYNNGWTDWSVR